MVALLRILDDRLGQRLSTTVSEGHDGCCAHTCLGRQEATYQTEAVSSFAIVTVAENKLNLHFARLEAGDCFAADNTEAS